MGILLLSFDSLEAANQEFPQVFRYDQTLVSGLHSGLTKMIIGEIDLDEVTVNSMAHQKLKLITVSFLKEMPGLKSLGRILTVGNLRFPHSKIFSVTVLQRLSNHISPSLSLVKVSDCRFQVNEQK